LTRHRFHGDEKRFETVAAFVGDQFGHSVKYVADVAGGQGMLTRILRKRYNYECEVVDPRGWPLNGVPAREEYFEPEMASFYDLVIGLHPDQALPSVVAAGIVRPAVVIPCCNFFDRTQRLGRQELLEAIEKHLRQAGAGVQRFELPFSGPFNIALVTTPAEVPNRG
jgi:hypothetical protein